MAARRNKDKEERWNRLIKEYHLKFDPEVEEFLRHFMPSCIAGKYALGITVQVPLANRVKKNVDLKTLIMTRIRNGVGIGEGNIVVQDFAGGDFRATNLLITPKDTVPTKEGTFQFDMDSLGGLGFTQEEEDDLKYKL